MNIAAYIDHTILKPTTTNEEVLTLCQEALKFQFAAVCVPPNFVALAKSLLTNSEVKVATVIGFPFGYSNTAAKLAEINQAIEDGADELDMVHHLAALKNKDWELVEADVKACTEACHRKGKIIKVIVESGLLTDDELLECCKRYQHYPIDFMKTSTGYAAVGATTHAVQLMRANLPETIAIKASGGIRNFSFAQELVLAGANRLGCSASVSIATESQHN